MLPSQKCSDQTTVFMSGEQELLLRR